MSEGMTCALTGHRELPEGFDRSALYDALEALIREGCTTFCCGMARGFDLLALECLIDLKRRYHVRIQACIPHEGQERSFPRSERERYRSLLALCDEREVLAASYYAGCFLARNRYMAERADLVFAYCTRKTGGTAYTVRYARELGKKVVLFPSPL